MKKIFKGKTRLVLTIAVCIMFIAVAFSCAANEPLVESKFGKENDDNVRKTLDSRPRPFWALRFPELFYKIFNYDWNYWSNKPNLFSIPQGNVGIGTNNPQATLDIYDYDEPAEIRLASGLHGGSCSINFANSGWKIRSGQSTPPLSLGFRYDENEVMTLMGSKVGIGTVSPIESLHVNGNIFTSGNVRMDWNPLYLSGDTNEDYFHWVKATPFKGIDIRTHPIDSIEFGTSEKNGTPADSWMVIEDGNVGIGTTNPTSMLEVNGTIHSANGGFKFPDSTIQTTAATGGGNSTLDQAYDQGGPGMGRTITADAGAVNIIGPDGLTVNGNVGIGTSNPNRLLEIYTSSVLPQLRLSDYKGSWDIWSGDDFHINQVSSGNDWLLFHNASNTTRIGPNSEIYIDNNNCYIGIGTTNPGEQLVINSDEETRIFINSPEGSGPGIEWGSEGHEKWAMYRPAYTKDLRLHNTLSAGDIVTFQNSTGNVGIGTTNPNYLLDVFGYSDTVAQFSGRVKGADAVNDDEFVTKSQVDSIGVYYYTPSSTSDTNGNVGDTTWDDNYFYVKTNQGWKRVALETWE